MDAGLYLTYDDGDTYDSPSHSDEGEWAGDAEKRQPDDNENSFAEDAAAEENDDDQTQPEIKPARLCSSPLSSSSSPSDSTLFRRSSPGSPPLSSLSSASSLSASQSSNQLSLDCPVKREPEDSPPRAHLAADDGWNEYDHDGGGNDDNDHDSDDGDEEEEGEIPPELEVSLEKLKEKLENRRRALVLFPHSGRALCIAVILKHHNNRKHGFAPGWQSPARKSLAVVLVSSDLAAEVARDCMLRFDETRPLRITAYTGVGVTWLEPSQLSSDHTSNPLLSAFSESRDHIRRQIKHLLALKEGDIAAASERSKQLWSRRFWQRELTKTDVMVMTPLTLLVLMTHQFFQLDVFDCVIFDDVHLFSKIDIGESLREHTGDGRVRLRGFEPVHMLLSELEALDSPTQRLFGVGSTPCQLELSDVSREPVFNLWTHILERKFGAVVSFPLDALHVDPPLVVSTGSEELGTLATDYRVERVVLQELGRWAAQLLSDTKASIQKDLPSLSSAVALDDVRAPYVQRLRELSCQEDRLSASFDLFSPKLVCLLNLLHAELQQAAAEQRRARVVVVVEDMQVARTLHVLLEAHQFFADYSCGALLDVGEWSACDQSDRQRGLTVRQIVQTQRDFNRRHVDILVTTGGASLLGGLISPHAVDLVVYVCNDERPAGQQLLAFADYLDLLALVPPQRLVFLVRDAHAQPRLELARAHVLVQQLAAELEARDSVLAAPALPDELSGANYDLSAQLAAYYPLKLAGGRVAKLWQPAVPSVLERYIFQLPSDRYYAPHYRLEFTTVCSFYHPKIVLPLGAPVFAVDQSPSETQAKARARVIAQAVDVLFHFGALDQHLLPVATDSDVAAPPLRSFAPARLAHPLRCDASSTRHRLLVLSVGETALLSTGASGAAAAQSNPWLAAQQQLDPLVRWLCEKFWLTSLSWRAPLASVKLNIASVFSSLPLHLQYAFAQRAQGDCHFFLETQQRYFRKVSLVSFALADDIVQHMAAGQHEHEHEHQFDARFAEWSQLAGGRIGLLVADSASDQLLPPVVELQFPTFDCTVGLHFADDAVQLSADEQALLRHFQSWLAPIFAVPELPHLHCPCIVPLLPASDGSDAAALVDWARVMQLVDQHGKQRCGSVAAGHCLVRSDDGRLHRIVDGRQQPCGVKPLRVPNLLQRAADTAAAVQRLHVDADAVLPVDAALLDRLLIVPSVLVRIHQHALQQRLLGRSTNDPLLLNSATAKLVFPPASPRQPSPRKLARGLSYLRFELAQLLFVAHPHLDANSLARLRDRHMSVEQLAASSDSSPLAHFAACLLPIDPTSNASFTHPIFNLFFNSSFNFQAPSSSSSSATSLNSQPLDATSCTCDFPRSMCTLRRCNNLTLLAQHFICRFSSAKNRQGLIESSGLLGDGLQLLADFKASSGLAARAAVPWHQLELTGLTRDIADRIAQHLSHALHYQLRDKHLGLEVFSHLSYQPGDGDLKTARDLHSMLNNSSIETHLRGTIHFASVFAVHPDWDANFSFQIAAQRDYQRLAWLGRAAVELWACESANKALDAFEALVFQSRVLSEQALFEHLKDGPLLQLLSGSKLFAATNCSRLIEDLAGSKAKRFDFPLGDKEHLVDPHQKDYFDYWQGYDVSTLEVQPLVRVCVSFFFAVVGAVLFDSNYSWSATTAVLARLLTAGEHARHGHDLTAAARACAEGRISPPSLRTLLELSHCCGFPLELQVLERRAGAGPADEFRVVISSHGQQLATATHSERTSAVKQAAAQAVTAMRAAAKSTSWHATPPIWPPPPPRVTYRRQRPTAAASTTAETSSSSSSSSSSSTATQRKRATPDTPSTPSVRARKRTGSSALVYPFAPPPPAESLDEYLSIVAPSSIGIAAPPPPTPIAAVQMPLGRGQFSLVPAAPMPVPMAVPVSGTMLSSSSAAPLAFGLPPGSLVVDDRVCNGRAIRRPGADQYHCVLCRVDCSGYDAIEQHLRGKQHKQTIRFIEIAESLRAAQLRQPPRSFPDIEVNPPPYELQTISYTLAEIAQLPALQIGSYTCHCCLSPDNSIMVFHSPVSYEQHILGAAHKRKERDCRVPVAGPALGMFAPVLGGPPPPVPPRRLG